MRKLSSKVKLTFKSPLFWIVIVCFGITYLEFFTSSISFSLTRYCWNSPVEVFSGQYYRLFTALFLHLDIFHLSGNMLFLALLTWIISANITRFQYLMVLLFSGVFGNLLADTFITYLYKLDGHVWSFLTTIGYTYGAIGFSTAIMGLFSFTIIVFLFANARRFTKVKFKSGLLVFAVCSQILYTYQNLSTNPWLSIPSYSHIGGGLIGILLALIFLYRRHQRNESLIRE
ncbi:rhomboid family intramembrane serine protease [Lacticaseibacillus paracasei]|uniref:rhomboid family intramembrane serine protease n=1 Tax=Lacticaseibacillus paracasei TaxID=1597 RepID=UPI001EDDFB6B|nr:rhomboid family intramembrane serine protease [Lacticaseibacillus paracasei]MCG4285394.1 rhomboid family intramembrane serine protease [Lacticaseibacillus paracasei]